MRSGCLHLIPLPAAPYKTFPTGLGSYSQLTFYHKAVPPGLRYTAIGGVPFYRKIDPLLIRFSCCAGSWTPGMIETKCFDLGILRIVPDQLIFPFDISSPSREVPAGRPYGRIACVVIVCQVPYGRPYELERTQHDGARVFYMRMNEKPDNRSIESRRMRYTWATNPTFQLRVRDYTRRIRQKILQGPS